MIRKDADKMLDIVFDPNSDDDEREAAVSTLIEAIAPDTLADSLRWRTVLDVLGGCTVCGKDEQFWGVKTRPAPKAIYQNNQKEFTAAIDDLIENPAE